MKFTKVRTVGLISTDLPMIGASVATDSYILEEVGGLTPVKRTNAFAKSRGKKTFVGGVNSDRYLTLKVRLNPNYSAGQTVDSLRMALYGLLTPGTGEEIQVQLFDGATMVARMPGVVSDFEAVPFGQVPKVLITVDCLNTYLDHPSLVSVATGGLSKPSPSIPNLGSAPAGFKMVVAFTANASSFVMTSADPTKFMAITYSFLSGDILTIDTRAGSKSLVRTRSGVGINLLGNLTPESSWLELRGGTNVFAVTPVNYNWTSFEYTPQYWGI